MSQPVISPIVFEMIVDFRLQGPLHLFLGVEAVQQTQPLVQLSAFILFARQVIELTHNCDEVAHYVGEKSHAKDHYEDVKDLFDV